MWQSSLVDIQFQPVTATVVDKLAAIVGANNVSTTEADRSLRLHDVSGHPAHLNDVVVWPSTAAQTAQALQLANALHIPVTPCDPTKRENLWYARYQAYTIVVNNHPDEKLLVLDAAVPISAYPVMVTQVQASLTRRKMPGYLMRHASDGNMHVLIPYTNDTYSQALAFN